MLYEQLLIKKPASIKINLKIQVYTKTIEQNVFID